MKVSILALTLNRYDIMIQALETSLQNAGHEYELIITDNGSSDQRVIEWAISKNPVYFRQNSTNEGNPKSLNQMYLRATGDFIVTLANDIVMPPNWLSTMVEYANKVPYCGLVGIHCVASKPPLTEYEGVKAHFINAKMNRVFSNIGFKREVVNKVGFYSEEFHPYGLADSDFCQRVTMAGFMSFYLPNLSSQHIGHDVGNKDEYRLMKDNYLKLNTKIFTDRTNKRLAALKEPLPEKRDAL